jgi:ComF family protein
MKLYTKTVEKIHRAGLQKFWMRFLNALFPTHCIACGKEGANFCSPCRERIPLRANFDSVGIFSLWEYGHPYVRNALLGLKYKNKRMIAADIAEPLYDALFEQLSEKSIFSDPIISHHYILVPIPLSKQRFKKRGYNQAELLAKELSRQNRTSFTLETGVLYKIKDTDTQVSVKDRAKRLKNIHGSFTVRNSDKIRGKTILIIDDIVTTGATIEEARRVLLKAGAKTVYGATVAH